MKRSADFQRVQENGRRLRGPKLSLVYAPGTAECSRAGWAVRRAVGPAVQRNKVKRWLREILRVEAGPSGGPWDLVFIPQPGVLDGGFHAIRVQTVDLLRRVRR